MAQYSLNEVLKAREAQTEKPADDGEVKLDDVTRVKVLSPTRQVIKRFLRNRLAIVGSIILITMFVFCFLGPIIYPYGQKDISYKYQAQNVNYALAKTNVNFNGYVVDDSVELDISTKNAMNSNVKHMIEEGKDKGVFVSEKESCVIEKLGDSVYTLSHADTTKICTVGGSNIKVGTFDLITNSVKYEKNIESIPGLEQMVKNTITKASTTGTFELEGVTFSYAKGNGKSFDITKFDDGLVYAEGVAEDAALEGAVMSAAQTGEGFELGGKEYVLSQEKEGVYTVYRMDGSDLAMVYSLFTIDTYQTGAKVSDEFKANALMAAYTTGEFTADGESYTITPVEGGLTVKTAAGEEFGEFGMMSVRRYSGGDTMDYQLKKDIMGAIAEMNASGEKKADIVCVLPQQILEGEDAGKYVYDENGELQYVESDLVITQKDTGEYQISCDQVIYVIDRFASPTLNHLLGTDGDGMDVLARIMYGGRISLLVGFVVVIIETILGVIMGGISGYFGGWVDTVIMRLVDIFYCLPSLPIMIIIGAMMDAVRMDPYNRLIIMMAALGVMGWAGVARLVRGQILSLREQEFMVAAEATGVKVRARIFRHLVPNVMPQLIVTATMGLGGVILEESTLSFLGLGVKHPMATWGTMINSVSTASAMAHYAYIWIPVGLLICLTVIAFNFVGDGLRDAYDPRAKR